MNRRTFFSKRKLAAIQTDLFKQRFDCTTSPAAKLKLPFYLSIPDQLTSF